MGTTTLKAVFLSGEPAEYTTSILTSGKDAIAATRNANQPGQQGFAEADVNGFVSGRSTEEDLHGTEESGETHPHSRNATQAKPEEPSPKLVGAA
jgi:hypothetical protein